MGIGDGSNKIKIYSKSGIKDVSERVREIFLGKITQRQIRNPEKPKSLHEPQHTMNTNATVKI